MLSAIQAQQKKLQPTTTIVTTASGQVFREEKDGALVSIEGKRAVLIEAAPDPVLARVLDRVYLGSQDAAANLEGMLAANITHVLNVATGIKPLFEDKFIYRNVEILDLPEVAIDQYFDECFGFIDEALKMPNGAVLVHCNAGVSRSASIVIGYVMKTKQLPYEAAHDLVKQARSQIRPNEGFVKRLKSDWLRS
eukprot:TRINITY_DN11857_c0_g1_i1.p1 TRINITY_DN11857_c0_g1~~TRINITY_DN11857_c0_g1_i1.p1  ORF type:complete len:194 (+),score=39.36 TRINITY_DN11857_c0_g1_i1:159-740(+)